MYFDSDSAKFRELGSACARAGGMSGTTAAAVASACAGGPWRSGEGSASVIEDFEI